ncbi:MAG TPA: hypothetical protein VLC79_17585 [Cellvibrio sp.]|nr:hypothetical protein [Cellvibrio sp.]
MPTKLSATQGGMSLVSLMVGLLLSMIGILAAMTLYKNLVHASVEARADAAQDGQLASAMLSLQLELQSAGYGIAKTDPGTHLQLVAGPPRTLYWRYRSAAGSNEFVCRGFRIEDKDNNTRRELQLLSLPTASCNASGNLSSLLGWSSNVIAEFRTSAAAPNLPAIDITNSVQTCFPYGMGESANHQMVIITADNAARRVAANAGTTMPNAALVYNFCLPNL